MAARSGRSKEGQKRESFIQPLTAVIRNHGQLTPVELAVYLDLQTYDWDGEGTWVGQRTIADELGISERTVRDAVKKLHRVGAIECQPRPGGSNLYKVKSAWMPADPGNSRRGESSTTAPPTPAKSAAHPGKICRPPRQNLPPRQIQRATPKKQTQGQTPSRRLRRRMNRCLGSPRKRARNRPRKGPQRPRRKRQRPRRLVPLRILSLGAVSASRIWPRASVISTTAPPVLIPPRKLRSSTSPPGSTRSR